MDSRNDVLRFMVACDQTETGLESNQALLYIKLIREEFQELIDAYLDRNMVKVADGCADLKWVIEGLEHTLQVPQQKVWDEVARSNLDKISDNGKVIKREDGKVLKPDNWTPPNIEQFFE